MGEGKNFDKIIRSGFYLLFFLTPLLFSPWNFELFEFPKMYFVYLITAVIMAGWLGKMVVNGEFKISRTPLDIPIILYLISSILSTIFSIHPYTSFWGYYSRSHGGLLSTICYVLLYYAFLTNQKLTRPRLARNKIRNIKNQNSLFVMRSIKILLASVSLVAVYGILERFGIDDQYWIQDVKNRVFSTLGQPNWLGALLVSLIFIPLSQIVSSKKKLSQLSTLLYYLLLICLIFTSSKSAILAFWLCLPLFLGFACWQQKKHRRKSFISLGLTLLIYILLGTKTYSYVNKLPIWLQMFQKQPPKELSQLVSQPNKPFISGSPEIRKIVWQGALKIWQEYPIFGSGLETFGYSYYNHRPQAHNLLSEWDFLYNKAHNEFLNILACQGIVGLLTYLGIIITFIVWSLKNIKAGRPAAQLYAAFLCGYLTLFITNFFGFSVVIMGLLFWLIPAFCFSLAQTNNSSQKIGFKLPTHTASQYLVLTTIFALLLAAGRLLLNRFRADLNYSRAEKFYKTDNLAYALPLLQKAIQLNPQEALYHAYMSKTSAKLAVAYSSIKASAKTDDQPENEESSQISLQLEQLAQLEINQTLKLNKVHLNFWKNKAEVYLLLSYIKPEYRKEAKAALMEAKRLAPTDAKILYNLGLLEKEDKNFIRAIFLWGQALQLKPNYEKVYLDLAETYWEMGEKEQAKQKAEFVLKNFNASQPQALEILSRL